MSANAEQSVAAAADARAPAPAVEVSRPVDQAQNTETGPNVLTAEEMMKIRQGTMPPRAEPPRMTREEMEMRMTEQNFKAAMEMCNTVKYSSVFDEAMARNEIVRQFMLMSDGKGPRQGADITTRAWKLLQNAQFIQRLIESYHADQNNYPDLDTFRKASYTESIDGSPFVGMILSQGAIDKKTHDDLKDAAVDLDAGASSLLDMIGTGGFHATANPKDILYTVEKLTDRVNRVKELFRSNGCSKWVTAEEAVKIMNNNFVSGLKFIRSYYQCRNPATKSS